VGEANLPVLVCRRRSRRRIPVQRHPEQLHVVTFRTLPTGLHPQFATILVRGKMGQHIAIDLACAQARPMAAEAPLLTDISTVPAPRPTPSLDALTRRHHHSHCGPPITWRGGAAVFNGTQTMLGVVMIGNPVARALNGRGIAEVNRLCVRRDLAPMLTRDACSTLYAAAAKWAARAGFSRLVT